MKIENRNVENKIKIEVIILSIPFSSGYRRTAKIDYV
tara:strand:+ start:6077 stop:6187 length:111 start_codon:yes stop_codon:yes gene_type:complete